MISQRPGESPDQCLLFEIASPDDGEFLHINVFAERCPNILRAQCHDPLLLFGHMGEGPPHVQVRNNLTSDRRVAVSSNFLGFQKRLFGIGKFGIRWTIGQKLGSSSSIAAFSTLSMLAGLVIAVIVKLATASRGEAVNADVTP